MDEVTDAAVRKAIEDTLIDANLPSFSNYSRVAAELILEDLRSHSFSLTKLEFDGILLEMESEGLVKNIQALGKGIVEVKPQLELYIRHASENEGWDIDEDANDLRDVVFGLPHGARPEKLLEILGPEWGAKRLNIAMALAVEKGLVRGSKTVLTDSEFLIPGGVYR